MCTNYKLQKTEALVLKWLEETFGDEFESGYIGITDTVEDRLYNELVKEYLRLDIPIPEGIDEFTDQFLWFCADQWDNQYIEWMAVEIECMDRFDLGGHDPIAIAEGLMQPVEKTGLFCMKYKSTADYISDVLHDLGETDYDEDLMLSLREYDMTRLIAKECY